MIKQESRAYFKALGAQVSALRKARGMTQAELARAIGVSQQAVFAYELGDRRISVLVLAISRRYSRSRSRKWSACPSQYVFPRGDCLRVV